MKRDWTPYRTSDLVLPGGFPESLGDKVIGVTPGLLGQWEGEIYEVKSFPFHLAEEQATEELVGKEGILFHSKGPSGWRMAIV